MDNYRRIIRGYEPKEPTNTFSFYKRKLNPYRVFGVVGQSPTVLKENLISASLKNLQNLLEIFFNKLFFLKRKVLWGLPMWTRDFRYAY